MYDNIGQIISSGLVGVIIGCATTFWVMANKHHLLSGAGFSIPITVIGVMGYATLFINIIVFIVNNW